MSTVLYRTGTRRAIAAAVVTTLAIHWPIVAAILILAAATTWAAITTWAWTRVTPTRFYTVTLLAGLTLAALTAGTPAHGIDTAGNMTLAVTVTR